MVAIQFGKWEIGPIYQTHFYQNTHFFIPVKFSFVGLFIYCIVNAWSGKNEPYWN